MKIIISPAKKMNIDSDSFPPLHSPMFLKKTEELMKMLKAMSYEELKNLWNCSDTIATQHYQQLKTMELHRNITPAIFAYEGIQYQYMAPNIFEAEELQYIESHLCILSGFYGLLRPLDGVVPYRLEMQAKLKSENFTSLYEFWGDTLAQQLFSESHTIINLASKEYSKCISAFLPQDVTFITCVFGEPKGDKIIEKGTLCKMARGNMVRFMAENKIQSPEELKKFDGLGYLYSEALSKENNYVFIKNKNVL